MGRLAFRWAIHPPGNNVTQRCELGSDWDLLAPAFAQRPPLARSDGESGTSASLRGVPDGLVQQNDASVPPTVALTSVT